MKLLAFLLLCASAQAQTYSGIATPEHPFVEIPGQPGATSVTVTIRTTVERQFMAANLDTSAPGIVTFNAPGSYQRVIVRDALGGIVGTQQGSPLPFTMALAGSAPESATFSQITGQSSQINAIGKGFSAPTVTLPVVFSAQYATAFQSGLVRARESVHPVALITVTYN